MGIPANYAGMTAFGELWVGDDGLPLRQTITLQFPPGPEVRDEAEITVDFRNFGNVTAGAVQVASLSDIGAKDTLNNLQSIWRDAFGRGTGSQGMGITKTLVIATGLLGAILLAAGVGTDNQALAITGAVILWVATFVVLVVAPVLNIKTAVTNLKSLTSLGAGARVKSVLGGSATLLGNPVKSNVLGLVLDVGITWVVFGIQVATADSLTSIEFNSLLAGAIASTILAVLFFALSFSVIGFLIVTITAVIDLLLSLLCSLDVDTDPADVTEEGDCFTITGYVTELLAGLLYSYDSTVDYDREDPALVEFQGLDYELGDNDDEWTLSGLWYEMEYTIIILFGPIDGTLDQFYALRLDEEVRSESHTLQAGLDQQWPLFLDTSYAIPAYDCWVNFCGSETLESDPDDAEPSDLSDAFTFDVYPATLDEFYSWAWDNRLGNPVDHDGDGLLSSKAGGNDHRPPRRPRRADGGRHPDSHPRCPFRHPPGLEWQRVGDRSGAPHHKLPSRTRAIRPASALRRPGHHPGHAHPPAGCCQPQNQLRLWAVAPDHNPLNDRRVVSPLARGRVLGDYDLTQSFSWPGLGDGVRPNAGQFANSDLRLSLTYSLIIVGHVRYIPALFSGEPVFSLHLPLVSGAPGNREREQPYSFLAETPYR